MPRTARRVFGGTAYMADSPLVAGVTWEAMDLRRSLMFAVEREKMRLGEERSRQGMCRQGKARAKTRVRGDGRQIAEAERHVS